jgi:hypothetical protein
MRDEDIEHALRSLAVTGSEKEPRYRLDDETLERLVDLQLKACKPTENPKDETDEKAFAVLRNLPIYSKRLLQIFVPTAAVIVAFLALRPLPRPIDPHSGSITQEVRHFATIRVEQWHDFPRPGFHGAGTFSGPFAEFNQEVGLRCDFPARKVVIRLAGGRLLSGSLTPDPSLNEPKRSDRQYYRVDVSGSLKDGTVVQASGSLTAVDPVLAQTPAASVNGEDIAEATLVLEVFAEGRSLGKLERTRFR